MSTAGPSQTTTGVHRRKSSRDEDDNVLIFPLDDQPGPTVSLSPPPKGINKIDAGANGSAGDHEASSSRPNEFRPAPTANTNGTEHEGWGARSQFASTRSRVTSVPAVPSPLNGQFPAQRSPPSNPRKSSNALGSESWATLPRIV